MQTLATPRATRPLHAAQLRFTCAVEQDDEHHNKLEVWMRGELLSRPLHLWPPPC